MASAAVRRPSRKKKRGEGDSASITLTRSVSPLESCLPLGQTPCVRPGSWPLSLHQAYLTYTTSVALGAQSGIEECKFQFAWERWNCPENALQLSTHNRLRSATRETSFIHAISSAGVMHTITKNCSMGDFENCGCDESKNGKTGSESHHEKDLQVSRHLGELQHPDLLVAAG